MQDHEATNPMVRLYQGFCQLIYHDFSWAYDLTSCLVSLGQWPSWQKQVLQYAKTGRILEMGFGTGVLHAHMLQQGMDVMGLDLSTQMQWRCQTRLQKLHLRGRCVCASGRQLPFADESFDHIVATFPEDYIKEDATLRECQRVLKKKAHGATPSSLVITGHWIMLKKSWLRPLFPVFFRQPTAEHVESLRRHLEAAGFELHLHVDQRAWVELYTIEARLCQVG